MRILGIAGSVRRGSHNRRLIRAAGDTLPSGVELVEWEGLAGLPIFDEDLENDAPEAVREFLAAVDDADAFGNTRGHLNLEAVVDRTEFDMNWNAPLPSGGKALANDVTLTVELSLVEQQA
jgi:hypothetical protein